MALKLHDLLLVVMAICVGLSIPTSVRAETEVDLALVLAVDVSRSMDPEEQELQRKGFVQAFRSPNVHDAIHHGTLGRIVVTYVEWSGEDYQKVIVPWTIIDDPESATSLPKDLELGQSVVSSELQSQGLTTLA